MLLTICLLVEILAFSVLRGSAHYLSNTLVTAAIIIDSLALGFDMRKSRRWRDVSVIVLAGYLVRLVLVYLGLFAGVALIGGDKDATRFFRYMTYIGLEQESHYSLFADVFGYLFRLTGISQLFAQYMVVLCSIGAILFTDSAMAEAGVGRKSRRIATAIMTFLPFHISMSAVLLRETPIAMFAAIYLHMFIKWYNTGRERYFVYALVASVGAVLLHSGTVSLAVGMVLVRLLYDNRSRSFKLKAQNVLLFLVIMLAFLYVYNRLENTLFYKISGVDSIADIASTSSRGNSSYARYVGDSSTLPRMILFTPIRIVYYLFSPFPWRWRGLTDAIAFVFSCAFYGWCLWQGIGYIRKRTSPQRNLVILLLIIIGCVTFVFAWGVTNSGTALRHRDKILCLFVAMLGICLDRPRKRRRRAVGTVVQPRR